MQRSVEIKIGGKTSPKPGQWVVVDVNGKEIPARIRAVMGGYCKLELSKHVYLDGRRTRVYVVKLKDIK